MYITRRQLLTAAAATGTGLLLPVGLSRSAAAPPRVKKFRDPLTWPAFVDGTQPVALSIVNSEHAFSSQLGTGRTLSYQLTAGRTLAEGPRPMPGYLGPTIVVPTGGQTTVQTTNAVTDHPLWRSLDPAVHGTLAGVAGQARTAVHLHGGNTSVEDDGGPLDTFPVGHDGEPGYPNPYTYTYGNTQDAAGLWYHDHALGITRLNVYAGLAAGYLIRDTAATGIDTGDGVLLPAPPYEIPLIIQDKRFNTDGSMFYDSAPWVPEFFGDTAVVNGTAFPYLDVDQGVYRFRVYNGSNARFYRLALKIKASGALLRFWQIGSDGGLLNEPVPLTNLLIAPGERADLLVDFRGLAGELVEIGNSAVAPFPGGARAGRRDGVPLPQVMQFRVGRAPGWTPPRPIEGMQLRPVTPVTRLDGLARGTAVRTHSLVEISDATDEVLMATLDNRTFDSEDYAAYPIAPNTLEVWEFANATADAHPLHLHLVQFQVLGRQPFDAQRYLDNHYADPATGLIAPDTGPYPAPSPTPYLTGPVRAPAANELGWKDTVQVPPGMVTRIAVPFGSGAVDVPIASRRVYSGDYVWHCHILEHEDNEMMQRYRVGQPS